MLLQRPPVPALAPFVERLWHFGDPGNGSPRERALPTGSADLVVRLSDRPVRLFAGADDRAGETFGHAVLAGARSSFHLRDASGPTCSAGVHFRPGGASALLGVPGDELSGRHTRLEELWGRSAGTVRERLLEQASPEARLALLERLLLARCPEPEPLHPAVARALSVLGAPGARSIAELAREAGVSHRWLIVRFRRSVGLGPKVYARIRRFQRALARAARGCACGWAQLALECGFSDQSHLVREFQAIAGLSPGEYRPLSPGRPNHVPEIEVKNVQARRRGRD
jgi:AraC-like DNA-binding protein